MYKREEVRPSVENRKLMVAIDGTSVTVPEIEPKSKQQNNTWCIHKYRGFNDKSWFFKSTLESKEFVLCICTTIPSVKLL
jgi:hypothetical protein